MKTSIPWSIAVLAAFALAGQVLAEDPPPAAEKPAEAVKPAKPTAPAAATKSGRKSADRLDLDTTVVTGNRELPKVLYIVPWKKADLGDLPGQPFNSLLDDALTPVDRDVFRREVTYYDAVAAGHGSGAEPAPSESPTGKAQ